MNLCVPGEGGVDGDGDITRPENITAFRNFVLESTEKRGLHFLMADGVRPFHFSFLFLTQSIFVAKSKMCTSNRGLGHMAWLLMSFSAFCLVV